MHGVRRIGGLVALLVVPALLLGAAPARAIEPYLVSVGILGGVGGPLDASDPDPGLGNKTLQFQVGVLTEPHMQLQFRLGRIAFHDDDRLGSLFSPDLSYLTVAGEYRIERSFYDSGLFLGLGAYRLSGDDFAGKSHDQTTIGGTLGVDGEFEINRWLAVVGEFALHWADFDDATFFGTAQGGLMVKVW